ncbi:MAG TPA: alpha/beta hydrolase [Blastocatellia bacterium]|nr:alpha/beta hydrolase [Blastocatellia bacterium]
MKLLRISVIFSLFLGSVSLAQAQQGPDRMEMDCLKLSNSSRRVPPGPPGLAVAYHHVWIPDLTYGAFESNGRQMYYELEGKGDEMVIVVPGGPGMPQEYVLPMLSNLGKYVKLVYYNNRIDYLSTKFPYQPMTLAEMAEDIDALRRALGLRRVTLLAHSFGGAIALTYALQYPDNVKRLLLVSTTAAFENPVDTEKRVASLLTPEEREMYHVGEGVAGGPCERVLRRYRALFPHYFHQKPDKDRLDDGVYSIYFDALARKLVYGGNDGGFDVRAQLERVKAPTLVIAGRHDVVTPLEQVSELAKGLPMGKLAVLNHSGHFPFHEENYMFTEWVRQFVAATNDRLGDRLTDGPVTVDAPGSR